MSIKIFQPLWAFILPLLACGIYLLGIDNSIIVEVVAGVLLIGSVLAAVHHAETIAHKLGEPFGTIILAVAITVIEVALIISLMVAGGPEAETLPRDTVLAAIMLILNGIIGLCLLIGGAKFHEQYFGKKSANTALITLISILVLTLVLPNYTTSVRGPYYNTSQLIFVAIISLILYGSFIMVQTVRHKDYFVTEGETQPHEEVTTQKMILSLVFLVLCLGIVVLLAKALSPSIEKMVIDIGAPKSLVGVIIAAVVLLPEGISAIKAARKNQLQTSLNLALGSALASIGLTIPAVVVVCLMYDIDLVLGIDVKSMVLLALSFFIVMLSLNQGKTNLHYGVVLLVSLVAYIFNVIVP
ncbi:calcium:proton antiporter [Elizabethkingia meningoseptica]|uniref:calcium:proton antiporter n=1 Tax=Elizabethkingia meningoseptica TaxID=238 RepID=UPI0023AEB1E4|nr:ionic transporter y4hA [Elizabethkingia meningoseptica]MDE5492015.1 ionic transporter y4hA [Elizabethkingia meningoseptica]